MGLKNYDCEGQISMFDFLEPEKEEVFVCEPPFDKSLLDGIKGIDEIIPNLPKYEIVLKKADFKGKTRKTAVWVGYWHSISDSGWNYEMEDIESYTELKKNECKYSGHTCNKEELWKVAESLDDPFCPHVCCRFCSTKQCGARCNGSEEPKKAAVDYETWHDIEDKPPEDAFCMFEYVWTRNQKEDSKGQCKGWWSNGKVKWLNMPWDIGKKRVIRWKYAEEPKEAAEPECTKANECEAYPTGCGGSIEPCRFGGPFKWSEKAQEVEVRGLCDDGYCPKCKIWLDDLVERCPECNTLLDWTHWKRLNEER